MSVDLSRVKIELARLAGPGSISLGAEGIYRALKEVTEIFEKDKDFKKILGKKS